MKPFIYLLVGWLCLSCLSLNAANAVSFNLHSDSFKNLDILPKVNTCDGKDESPSLIWSGLPAKTQSLTLIFSDLDAQGGTFYHWVLYNMPAAIKNLPAGLKILPKGSAAGKNSWGKVQYNGPCPPKGSTHTYVFTLYALDAKIDVKPDADSIAVINAMQNHIIDKTELNVIYSRM